MLKIHKLAKVTEFPVKSKSSYVSFCIIAFLFRMSGYEWLFIFVNKRKRFNRKNHRCGKLRKVEREFGRQILPICVTKAEFIEYMMRPNKK